MIEKVDVDLENHKIYYVHYLYYNIFFNVAHYWNINLIKRIIVNIYD